MTAILEKFAIPEKFGQKQAEGRWSEDSHMMAESTA